MDDLIAFLTARLDEDERFAWAATPGPWWHNPGKVWLDAAAFVAFDRSKGEEFVGYDGPSPFTGCIAATGPGDDPESMANAAHIARHDPARVLREVEAKRRMIGRHQPHSMGNCRVCEAPHWGTQVCNHCSGQAWPCPDLQDLALVYSDHPDYLEEYRSAI